MMEVAIFGCHSATAKDIQTSGTKCYRIIAAGAPAEWVYALTTASWSLSLAFDIYITPIVGQAKSKQDQEETELLAPDPYSPYSLLSPPDNYPEKTETELLANIDKSRAQMKVDDRFKPATWARQTNSIQDGGEVEQDLGLMARPQGPV